MGFYEIEFLQNKPEFDTDKCLVSDIQQKINRSRNWVEGKVEQYFSSVFAKIGFNLKVISQKVRKNIAINLPIQKIITPTFEKTGPTFEKQVHH